MRLFRDLSLVSLVGDAVFEHLDSVLIKGLDRIDHHFLMHELLLLRLSELSLLRNEFVLLQLRCKLVHFLAKHHLLGVALVHLALLVPDEVVVRTLCPLDSLGVLG